MKRYEMTTVVREVPYSEIPKPWRQGLHGRTVRVTLEDVPPKKRNFRAEREAILAKVAGVWADRTDEDIEAWQNDLRQARKRRFDAIRNGPQKAQFNKRPKVHSLSFATHLITKAFS